MSQRLRGDEVSVLVTTGGVLEDTFDAISNFNLEIMTEVISTAFLGEKTERKDDIFKGVKFDFEMQVAKQNVFTFLDKVKKRAQRITPDLQFNITGVFNYANGDTVVATIPDAKFAATPIQTGSRSDYVKLKISGEADDWEPQQS